MDPQLTVTLARLRYQLTSVQVALEADSPQLAMDALKEAMAMLDKLNGAQ